jgi:tetratricopeptide (TPR) repeat protein
LWEEILAEPTPPGWAVIGRSLQHYSRGIAFANTGRDKEAREELSLFDEAIKNIPAEDWWLGGQAAVEIMPLARFVLVGEIELENKLVYAEPAPWMMPARHAYGALLIVDGQYKKAEQVYLQDLQVFPANGWALLGLRDSLRGQQRFEEAELTDKAFKLAWKSADVMPPASCYCGSAVASAE